MPAEAAVKDRVVRLLSLASRTALPSTEAFATGTPGTSRDVSKPFHRGIRVAINVTALAGSSLTVTIQAKDQIDNSYSTLLASAAITATGRTVLTVYPGIPVVGNVSASNVATPTVRVLVAGTPGTATYAIDAVLLA